MGRLAPIPVRLHARAVTRAIDNPPPERPARGAEGRARGAATQPPSRPLAGEAPHETETGTWGPGEVAAHLRGRDDLRQYLDAINDVDPGDGSLIRAALNDIARAYGLTRLARETGLSRVGIYKALAANRNPTFSTLMRIARALGLRLRVTM